MVIYEHRQAIDLTHKKLFKKELKKVLTRKAERGNINELSPRAAADKRLVL